MSFCVPLPSVVYQKTGSVTEMPIVQIVKMKMYPRDVVCDYMLSTYIWIVCFRCLDLLMAIIQCITYSVVFLWCNCYVSLLDDMCPLTLIIEIFFLNGKHFDYMQYFTSFKIKKNILSGKHFYYMQHFTSFKID